MPKTRLSDRRGWTVGAWVGGLWVELRRKNTTSQNLTALSRQELFILESSELSDFLRQKMFFVVFFLSK